MRYFIIVLFFFLSVSYLPGKPSPDSFQTGLTFKAHTYNQDERTALNLTPDAAFEYKSSFALDFNMKHLAESHTYGYVFRMVINDTIHLDMVTNRNGAKINFILGGKQGVLTNTEFLQQESIGQWLSIKIAITNDSLVFRINKTTKRLPNPYHQMKDIQVFFGQNKHPLFFTTDVAPMTIKEVSVFADHRKIREWDMWKHRNHEIYDKVKRKTATVTNGIWEIDKHIKWKKDFSHKINSLNPQIAYDQENSRIFVANEFQILEISLVNKTNKLINVSGGKPFIGVGSQLLYNSQTDRLISYSIEQQLTSEYDFTRNKWSQEETKVQSSNQHHNRYIDPKQQKVTFFGGYGFHQYNAMVTQLDISNGNWSQKNLAQVITPRYLSAFGRLDENNLLIIGGYGSETGKQEESPTNYYDVYQYNLESGTGTKLFNFVNDTQKHFTFSNSLVVDNDKVYALKYNNDRFKTSIHLFRLDLKSQQTYTWTDSIPYNFLDIQSFSDIVYCDKTSALYAIVVQKDDNNSSSVSIYSMKYPLLEDLEVLQSYGEAAHHWTISLITICIALIIYFIYIIYRKKTKLQKDIPNKSQAMLIPERDVSSQQTEKEKIKQSAIHLLGGFQIFSKTGENMTAMFTPVIRQLFLCILMHTVKNGKGISSDELNNIFWFDMEYKNALNNRRVNISKLRLILKEIGNINVLNTNSYWYIEFGEEISCDYQTIMKLLKKIKTTAVYDPEDIYTVIEIASHGTLLPSIQNEWIDDFKAAYADLLVNVLLEATKESPFSIDHKLLIDISNVILSQDNIDENGIRIKCRCLYQLGQKGLSKQVYDKFYTDYTRLLQATPELKYEDIIASS